MRHFIPTKLLGLLAASALVLGALPARAADVSVSVFYDSLEPYGEWIDAGDYGYAWHPRDVDESWRPYTLGNWAYTDAGWTWVSEEPFGWATYHYGRWVELESVGWSWVPDREWGPAWVSWRRGDQHVGWAPLPPEARFEARVGFGGWVDSYYDIGPANYTFVRSRDFGASRIRTVIIEPRENITFIRETRNITRITYVNNVIVDGGMEYDVISRQSSQPLRRLKLERRTDIDYREGGDRDRFATRVQGDTLRIAAPDVQISRDTAPKKLGRKLDRVEVNRGWKSAGDTAAVEQFRTRVASEEKAPADLPPAPRLIGSSDRKQRGARQQDGQPEAGKPAAATAEAPSPEKMKPDAEKTATTEKPKSARERLTSTPDAEAKTKGDAPKAAASAETSAPDMKEKRSAREEKTAQEKARPTADGAVERMPKRPEAREEQRPQAPVAEQKEKMKERSKPAARDNDRPSIERPEAGNPVRGKRPEAALDRPDRPERQVAPPSPAAEREPKRKGPPEREERSPDRSRPDAGDRSPQSRSAAPESASQNSPKNKGGKKAEAQKDDKKDDKKDNKKD